MTTPPKQLAPSSAGTRSFFSPYLALASANDELSDGAGVRPAWRQLDQMLAMVGHAELARRWWEAERAIHENGIAYSRHGDPAASLRPWALDPIPLVLSGEEWRGIEAGLKQRAELMRALIADIYGAQRTLQRGVLPPSLVFAHPSLRMPYYGSNPTLCFYGADLVRGPDRRWRVVNDRTDSPSGLGFALENRIVLSRVLPSCFRSGNVRRVASFFITLRKSVARFAGGVHPARVVSLTEPLPAQNYFEDAFLARYLGYTLAEGGDLAVRDGRVFHKTLSGLLPVHAILRRPNSEACDPLELDARPPHGAAGLTQAAREGNVALLNGLGTGLVESPAFQPFLPAICRELLGSDLLLESPQAWWCGDRDSLGYVLDNLTNLEVRPAFRARGTDRDLILSLDAQTPAALRETILSNPALYVARQRTPRSSAPRWRADDPTPQRGYVALRTYAVADDDGFSVMPGGLARISAAPESLEASLMAGEGSKDIWVLADQPDSQATLLQSPDESGRVVRVPNDLSSRDADNLFWLGRQVERLDAAARLLRTTVERLSSETGSALLADVPVLLRAMAEQGQIEPDFLVEGIRDRLPSIEAALPGMVFDHNQPGRLRHAVDETMRLAGAARSRLSTDTWRILLHLDDGFRQSTADTCDLADLLRIATRLIVDAAAFGGAVMESMTRSHAFRFLDMGRRIERAIKLAELLMGAFFHAAPPGELLESVLRIADSIMTYRARYLANLHGVGVLDLLIADESNPRSLVHQLVALAEHVSHLPRHDDRPGYSIEQRIVTSLLHRTRMIDLEQLWENKPPGEDSPLTQLLAEVRRQLPMLASALSHTYFVHAGRAGAEHHFTEFQADSVERRAE